VRRFTRVRRDANEPVPGTATPEGMNASAGTPLATVYFNKTELRARGAAAQAPRASGVLAGIGM
jgi:hypothetical protein